MKFYLIWMIWGVSLLSVGCGHLKQPSDDPYAQLVEAQPQMVADCEMLAAIAETADADKLFPYFARREMVKRVQTRAFQLGATHIVWLHRTNDSAAAKAYRCKAED